MRTPFRRSYLAAAIATLILGLLIFDTHGFGSHFVRFYVGDVIAIVFVYCFVSAVWRASVWLRVFVVFTFAVALELIQLWGGAREFVMAWRPYSDFILGQTFDKKDIVAYATGVVLVLAVEGCLRFLRPAPTILSNSPDAADTAELREETVARRE